MLFGILLRAYFSQSVRYWYEICDVLVPMFTCCEESVLILHSVKFTKCEICGSTRVDEYLGFIRYFIFVGTVRTWLKSSNS